MISKLLTEGGVGSKIVLDAASYAIRFEGGEAEVARRVGLGLACDPSLLKSLPFRLRVDFRISAWFV